jgi:uncharacterized protein YjbJ (UPF0337 family)
MTALQADWSVTKIKLKRKFAALTDGDLFLQRGKQDELIGRLQIRLGKTKAEIHKLIADL